MHTIAVVVMVGVSLLQTNQHVTEDSLLDRARRGDDSALDEMERSGDIRDLQSLLDDARYAGKDPVRLRLARLGDRDALQYFACRSLTDDVDKMQLLIRNDLDYIGGAFTIVIYRQLLDADTRFQPFVKRNKKHKYSDVIVRFPSSMVLPSLSRLLPESRIASPDFHVEAPQDNDLKARWRRWIDDHAVEIQTLRPSADGISFSSQFCKTFDKEMHAVKRSN